MKDRAMKDRNIKAGNKRQHRKSRTGKSRNHAGMTREELKRQRKRQRRRLVMIQKISIAVLVLVFIIGGGFLVWNLPAIQLDRQLSAGEEYTHEAAYLEAIEAYETALEIDSASVKAYRCMAGAYLDMEDASRAKQVLFEGWENTQDESLLQYYCTVTLNEAVEEINADEVTFDTAEKILRVLEQNELEEEAVKLMNTVYDRLMEKVPEGNFDFTAYEQVVQRLNSLYQNAHTPQLGALLSRYSMIKAEELVLPAAFAETYLKILESGNSVEELPERSDLIVCLQKEIEIQQMFADIFQEFDAGNYEAARDFIVTDEYVALRDGFINGTMEYWAGEMSIPLSREFVRLKQTEGRWTFEFPDFKENENTAGVITIGGADMKDNGVQRTTIAYEPPMENGVYYPHMEYVISYVYSNVQKKNSFDYEMNYHFETRVWTQEGMTTNIIGDWGGPYQWEKNY